MRNFDDFDASVSSEEFYAGHADMCLNCYCENCVCGDDEPEEFDENPCVHCGLVFGSCDCDQPSAEDEEWAAERRLRAEQYDNDYPQYDQDCDLWHEC